MPAARRAAAKGRSSSPVKLPLPAQRPPEQYRIPIDSIDWSSAIRPLNVAHVGRLGDAAQLPAIAVWEFERGKYRGIDGYHRWRLAKARREQTVSAAVQHFPAGEAGEKAFDLACVRSNLQHGLPLTREERDGAIVRIWSRWGRSSLRAEGETLDTLGSLFNLTKQRVHQIVSAADAAEAARVPQRSAAKARRSRTGRRAAPGRYSTFGRFSAGTRRLSRLLADADFVSALLRERQSEVVRELHQIRQMIDRILGANS
jgi:hypothetical protein